jgi:hypothetical protein
MPNSPFYWQSLLLFFGWLRCLSGATHSRSRKSNSVYVIKIETGIQMEQFIRRKVRENKTKKIFIWSNNKLRCCAVQTESVNMSHHEKRTDHAALLSIKTVYASAPPPTQTKKDSAIGERENGGSHVTKAANREDKRSRRYRDRDFAKFERSRRYRDR